MIRLVTLALMAAALAGPAVAKEYQATTNSNAIVRHAPGPGYGQLMTIPAGTPVEVLICFNRGEFCAVPALNGFVSGDLLSASDGQTLRTLEQVRWAAIDAMPRGLRMPDAQTILSPDIRLEGDSYSRGACGVSIRPALQASLGRSVITTGLGSSEIGAMRDRVNDPVNRALLGRVTVFWDGSQNGITTVDAYADIMGEAIATLGHDRFVVIPAAVPAGTGDASEPIAIRDEFERRWPGHVLDWRDVLPNTSGVLNADQMCDRVHLNEAALATMARGIAAFVRDKGW